MQYKKAFTLIELVFCIIIIAILASIAYPYFSFNKNDAKIIKLKSEVELINSSLALLRNQFIFNKNLDFPKILDEALINSENQKLFYCSNTQIQNCQGVNCCSYSVLQRPIIASKKSWMKIQNTKYRYFIDAKNYVDFVYNNEKIFLECMSKNCKDYGF
ncbi:prepilin-type N-terminal cleavage/methylation domain-containing protein [Campylobacter peloridis]|uniref:Prepilin-type N-terminal cleavage/methylation domain-containing protein n=1 Tax=Campylobacter peloridis TaxID=488546 RepID=A0ABX6TVB1_9BACT|nr:prepilin-type N-terminal cleavage/methylation domain-containing protein [Campylobacter peloridis]AJC85111.1 putative type II secretion system protein [Campylobacter peloridis LMG 23910]MBX1885900.1 prepilin-type N-terminal cleavage/methylation domain-containing protein [Campylobacter peloridis]MBX2078916.1 prepilin-type N-terminal cleavage/methylation domain-containing protein [Campylobacter peloridis]QOQ89139.1 prepilin-type N-terminal cleavage/methylation domain-containing protein [Campylo